jgi:hypothetical protein
MRIPDAKNKSKPDDPNKPQWWRVIIGTTPPETKAAPAKLRSKNTNTERPRVSAARLTSKRGGDQNKPYDRASDGDRPRRRVLHQLQFHQHLTSVRSRARDAMRQLYNLERQQGAARVACSAKVRRG